MDGNWKTLFDDYLISDKGEIFSTRLGRNISQNKDNCGYLVVTLRLDVCKRKTYKVHRLVAKTFIPNPERKPTVNHKDGNKLNNHVENLEWMTRSEQVQHAWDNGLIKNLEARKKGIRNKQGKPVICLTTGETWNSIGAAAEDLGLKKSNISAVCLNKKGFKSAGKTKEGIPRVWRFYEY